jgi:hypothetical protein
MNDTSYQSVTELAAIHPNLAEYLGQLERELAALRESYAYAEISLPAELIPARKEAK